MKWTIPLAALALSAAAPAPRQDDPLLRPIAPERAAEWLGPQAPIRIYGNSYLVGFEGLNVGLIDTGGGLILIDGAMPQGVRMIEANLKALGYRIEDVKLILSTEPHYDHASGIAALARDSGATVLAGAWAAAALRRGISGPEDPQTGLVLPYPPVTRVRAVKNGEAIRLGSVTVTAHATPGHTPGSMSWSWRSCEAHACKTVVFSASLNPIAADGYRFTNHPQVVAGFHASFARFRAMSCDILITSHPGQSDGDEKRQRFDAGAKPNPYVDPAACRAYADEFAGLLAKRLADEKAGAVR